MKEPKLQWLAEVIVVCSAITFFWVWFGGKVL